MIENDLLLLDCTLRDGGYVNDWRWGFHAAQEIIRSLVKSNVDVIEVGFLRNVSQYDIDVTVCNYIEELNRLLPEEEKKAMFSAMTMISNYDITNLSSYSGQGIEMIRVTFHENDISEGIDFAKQVKLKGYKLSINPINIMGYSDRQILWLIEQVNMLEPYQFAIVDTFGSMKRRDLERIMYLVDNNLNKDIRVALHLHENMSLSSLLAQNFVDSHLRRPISIDASLMGIGRTPGNLPIELIADYLNDYLNKSYRLDYMMDSIQDYIMPIKGESKWGYSPAYFLSAKFNLHRNYAEYYLEKGDLTNRDINHILSGFDKKYAGIFNKEYAEHKYTEYKDIKVDDKADRETLSKEFINKEILVLAPGHSIKEHRDKINQYIRQNTPLVITTNFITDSFPIDYAFFCNNRRYVRLKSRSSKIIITSNLSKKHADYVINYNSVADAFPQGNNSLVMILRLLDELGIKEITLAGADGFDSDDNNYFQSDLRSSTLLDDGYNISVSKAIKSIGVRVKFITPSKYEWS